MRRRTPIGGLRRGEEGAIGALQKIEKCWFQSKLVNQQSQRHEQSSVSVASKVQHLCFSNDVSKKCYLSEDVDAVSRSLEGEARPEGVVEVLVGKFCKLLLIRRPEGGGKQGQK